MADRGVVGANENMLNDSMDKILITNISRDIDILLDGRGKEESDKYFIEIVNLEHRLCFFSHHSQCPNLAI